MEAKTLKINGKNVPYDFKGKYELHLNPLGYGIFDVIGRETDDGLEEVLYKNAIISFINPGGYDMKMEFRLLLKQKGASLTWLTVLLTGKFVQ